MLLITSEGGAADKTLSGVQPILDALKKDTGVSVEAKVADNYAGVIEGLATRHADMAQLGPFAYLKARERHAAELLAVAVRKGESGYYGGIFCRADSGITSLKDLKGKTLALGDVNSMSSFNYPCAMLLGSGVDPSKDLAAVYLAGSHPNVVAALAAGKVDAGACTVSTYEAAVREGRIDPKRFKLLAKSDMIPGSPIVVFPGLAPELKEKLRAGYKGLAKSPSLPKGLRGLDGRPLDGYDTTITDADYDAIAKYVRPITDDFKAAILARAGKKL